jgi:hypothetical protein
MNYGCIKPDSHIACCARATPMLFSCHDMPYIHTCHPTPLSCSDSVMSFMVAGNIQTASPAV